MKVLLTLLLFSFSFITQAQAQVYNLISNGNLLIITQKKGSAQDTTAILRKNNIMTEFYGPFIYISNCRKTFKIHLDSIENVKGPSDLSNLQSSIDNESSKALIGTIVFAVPSGARHKIDGSSFFDPVLASELEIRPIQGFTTSNDTVYTPDWSGRSLMGSGGLSIPAGDGVLFDDKTAKNGLVLQSAGSHVHRIRYTNGGAGAGFLPLAQDAIGYQYNSVSSTNPDMDAAGNHTHTMAGDSETRPNGVAMSICIIGS